MFLRLHVRKKLHAVCTSGSLPESYVPTERKIMGGGLRPIWKDLSCFNLAGVSTLSFVSDWISPRLCGSGCRDALWGADQQTDAGETGAGVGEGLPGPLISTSTQLFWTYSPRDYADVLAFVLSGRPSASGWHSGERAHRAAPRRQEAGLFLLYVTILRISDSWLLQQPCVFSSQVSGQNQKHRGGEGMKRWAPNVSTWYSVSYWIICFEWCSKFTHLSCTVLAFRVDSFLLCSAIYGFFDTTTVI